MSSVTLTFETPRRPLTMTDDSASGFYLVFENNIQNPDSLHTSFDDFLAQIQKLNRTEVKAAKRLAIIHNSFNHYFSFVRELRSGQRHTKEANIRRLPLANKEVTLAAKILLTENAAHSKEEMANIAYWLLNGLAEQINDYSLLNYAQPDELWGELNSVFEFAESHFISEFNTNKPFNESIKCTYLRAMLLNAAQPAHLNTQEHKIASAYLNRWSKKAGLTELDEKFFDATHYYLDLASSKPACLARDIHTSEHSDNIRVMDIQPLIILAQSHLKKLRGGIKPSEIGFSKRTDPIDAFMTLKKVIHSWRQDASRKAERAHCAQDSQTFIGLDAIYEHLKSPTGQKPENFVASNTINVSESGACVKVNQWADVEYLSVGDFLLHRTSKDKDDRLAVVRWLKKEDEAVILGIEFITGNLQPVLLETNNHSTPALLVSRSNNDTIITPKGYCKNKTPIELKTLRHNISLTARVHALIQRGQHADQISLKRGNAA